VHVRTRFLLLVAGPVIFIAAYSAPGQHVDVARLEGVIAPFSARYLVRAIDQAEEDGAECLIIEMDTPGGLDESMRQVIKRILAADVPVVVYVSPGGARAASAGAVIALAAHIAAMAPGTNIGAAHPVTIGGEGTDEVLSEKMTRDAAAYVRALAERRGRNVEWAERAVLESASATEEEALELSVIEYVALSIPGLLEKIDGHEVEVASGTVTLATREAATRQIAMGLRDEVFHVITNPNVAYILFILGFYGLLFELQNPGAIFPGVVGAICLILGFLAFQTLPINYAGLLLIVLAMILFILELKVPSHGILTIGGVAAMVLGSVLLIDSSEPFLRVSWSVIIPAVLTTVAFFVFAVGMGLRAQLRKPATGSEGLTGLIGVVRSPIDAESEGTVLVHGEIWRATSDERIEKGERVKVTGVEGLTARVTGV